MGNAEKLVLRNIGERSGGQLIHFSTSGHADTPFTGSEVLFANNEQGDEVVIKFSSYPWGANREWRGLQKLKKANISIPEPLFLVEDQSQRKGIITQKIEGENLFEARQPNDQLKHKLGIIIRNMHGNTQISGREWQSSGKSEFTYYDTRISKWQQSLLAELQKQSPGTVLLEKFGRLIESHLPSVVPVFTHNDLHDAQVLVTENQELVIIDVEMWQEESPLKEIAYYLFHSIRMGRPAADFTEFAQGYLNNSTFSAQDKNFITFYLLNITLGGVYLFSQYRKKELWVAQKYLKEVIDFIEQESLWKNF